LTSSSIKGHVAAQKIDGQCVWYGICERTHNGEKIKNCEYNGPPKALNETAVHALRQWCSHLIPEDYSSKNLSVNTCCDYAQVRRRIERNIWNI
jgi:hypothetical protein